MNRPARRPAASAVLALLLTIAAPATGTAAASAATAPPLEALTAELDALRRQANVPAMALAILVDGRPSVLAGLGRASADTPFRWGSITKSFTGLAALTLTREGPVLLTASVRATLGADYYRNRWSATRPVRLVHLLTLSAGFGDLSRAEWEGTEPLPLWTALARYAPERVVRWPPGLQHSYSNAPAGLAAAMIERLSGMPFESFLAERVFAPLGMTNATLAPVPGLPGGFRADGETEIPYWHVTYPAFGAMNASVRDMGRFLTALLNDGRVPGAAGLPAGLVARFFRPDGTLGTAAGLEVGYGAGIYGRVRDGHVFLGHGGDADGYRSRYGVLPGHGRGYALVINTDNPRLLRRLERLVETALVRDLPAHPPPPASTEDLAPYVGTYYASSSRFSGRPAARAQVTVEGGTLRFLQDDRSTPLYPVGAGRFLRPGDPAVTVVFVRQGDNLYLQGELGNFVNLSRGPCPDFLGACE